MLQRVGDTDYATKIKDWVNFSHTTLGNAYDYWNELESVHNFATVDGTENYYMPIWFDKPFRVYDLSNNRELDAITEEEYFDANIANISGAVEAAPTFYRLYGYKGINTDLSASGTIVKVKSTSASDTAGAVIRVEGYTDSAKTILDYEDITVSTATPTTFVSGTKTFYDILHISKSADTTGNIVIANSAGTTISQLPPTIRTARYKVMKLGKIPDSAYNIRVLYKKSVNKLVNDNDYPFISADEFIVTHSVAYGLMQEKETSDRAAAMFQKASDALQVLLRTQNNRLGPGYQHKITNSFMGAHRR